MQENSTSVSNTENLARRRRHSPPLTISTGPRQAHTRHSFLESPLDIKISPERRGAGEAIPEEGNEFCTAESSQVLGHANRRESLRQPASEGLVDEYKHWVSVQATKSRPEYPTRHQSLIHRPSRSESLLEPLRSPADLSAALGEGVVGEFDPDASRNLSRIPELSPQFSPLHLYFRGQSFPSTKKGEKTMIGQNGWLECSGKDLNHDPKPHIKRLGFLHNIKKIAKDVVCQMSLSPNVVIPYFL